MTLRNPKDIGTLELFNDVYTGNKLTLTQSLTDEDRFMLTLADRFVKLNRQGIYEVMRKLSIAYHQTDPNADDDLPF